MSAVFHAARGGLGGRKLQAVIIGLVVLVATAASVLALGMLADAHSPFDHAFAAQNGADVALTVDTSVASRPRSRPRPRSRASPPSPGRSPRRTSTRRCRYLASTARSPTR